MLQPPSTVGTPAPTAVIRPQIRTDPWVTCASTRHRRLELVGLQQLLGLRLLNALVQALRLMPVAQELGQGEAQPIRKKVDITK